MNAQASDEPGRHPISITIGPKSGGGRRGALIGMERAIATKQRAEILFEAVKFSGLTDEESLVLTSRCEGARARVIGEQIGKSHVAVLNIERRGALKLRSFLGTRGIKRVEDLPW